MTFGYQNPAYIFPDVGRAQGIQAQVQPNVLVGIDYVSYIHSLRSFATGESRISR